MKRDGLIIEFFKVLEKAKDSQSDLQQKHERATQMMAFANTVEGARGKIRSLLGPGGPGYHACKQEHHGGRCSGDRVIEGEKEPR